MEIHRLEEILEGVKKAVGKSEYNLKITSVVVRGDTVTFFGGYGEVVAQMSKDTYEALLAEEGDKK